MCKLRLKYMVICDINVLIYIRFGDYKHDR